MKILVVLIGCDDNTEIEMDVTPAELAVLKSLAVLSFEKSEYSCQPRMRIEERKE